MDSRMKVKIVHCPTSQDIRAKVKTLVTLIEQRLGIKAVTIPGTTGQFEVRANGQRIAGRGGNWPTSIFDFDAGYPDLERVVEELEKRRDAERMKRIYTISFINTATATIEVEQPGGRTYSLTRPKGRSIPEEFNVGSEIEIIMIYPATPEINQHGKIIQPFKTRRPTYWKIRHVPSEKVIMFFISGGRNC